MIGSNTVFAIKYLTIVSCKQFIVSRYWTHRCVATLLLVLSLSSLMQVATPLLCVVHLRHANSVTRTLYKTDKETLQHVSLVLHAVAGQC